MKVIDGFILRKIQNQFLLIAYGTRAKEYSSMITMTDSAAFLWNVLQKDISMDDLIDITRQTFPNTPESRIASDIFSFVEELKQEGLLEGDGGENRE